MNFYQKIKKKFKDKIVFLDEKINFNSFERLPKFTATINGTVALESVINNIPSIIFGHAWYQGCEGTHNIREIKNLKKFIKSKNLKILTIKKLNYFLIKQIELQCFITKIFKRILPPTQKIIKNYFIKKY